MGGLYLQLEDVSGVTSVGAATLRGSSARRRDAGGWRWSLRRRAGASRFPGLCFAETFDDGGYDGRDPDASHPLGRPVASGWHPATPLTSRPPANWSRTRPTSSAWSPIAAPTRPTSAYPQGGRHEAGRESSPPGARHEGTNTVHRMTPRRLPPDPAYGCCTVREYPLCTHRPSTEALNDKHSMINDRAATRVRALYSTDNINARRL